MTLSEGYAYSVQFLEFNGVDEAEFKALCVSCEAAGVKNSQYHFHKNDLISPKKLSDMLWRLKNGEALQYIIGKWPFYKYEFYVGPGVLIPRPETEELAALAIKEAKSRQSAVVFDLCSGSGCIGLSIAREALGSAVYCVEKSKEAFKYLQKNAAGISNASLACGDIFKPDGIDLPQKCDIIVSNPPYIKTADLPHLQKEVQQEPRPALDGGADGLDFYRAIAELWFDRLNRGGRILLEIGSEQGKDVKNLFTHLPLDNVTIIKDVYNNDRIFSAVRL
ncbi:MAG: peptide chain release factor N(5)-glutamine methyltransferase [Clostridiales bacterium]|nr:peptide chain release factor N(5)-glutamine methyltransferase [Clostridiales bacterium]